VLITGFALPHYLIFLKSLDVSIDFPEWALHTALRAGVVGF
jgi:hypothetical protein